MAPGSRRLGRAVTTLWDTATFQQVAVLPDGAWKVRFTPDGKRLVGVGPKGVWVRSAGD